MQYTDRQFHILSVIFCVGYAENDEDINSFSEAELTELHFERDGLDGVWESSDESLEAYITACEERGFDVR